MPSDKIDILTQSLRSEFVKGYTASADPVPVEKAVTIVPSNGRVENYAWMYPAPGISQWQGYRRYGKIGEINYRVPNYTFDGAFEILKEDIDDDQVGGYKLKAAELGQHAKEFKFINVQQTLALGQTTGCFDGTNFFASTHAIGSYPTGGNIVTGTAAASDGVTHCMVAMILANKTVKPLLWQNRDDAKFRTDAGSDEADKARVTRCWADLRGAAAFGYWWDAILVKFANTPTVAEMQTTLGNVNARFRQFKLPKNLASDPDQFIHGQVQFSTTNVLILCSSGIEHIARQALTLSLIAQTENFYKGWADLACSGYLDGVT